VYQKRLRTANIELQTEWHKSDGALVKSVEGDRQKQFAVVLLDPNGTECTSEEFADSFYHWIERGGSRLVFVVGGGKIDSLLKVARRLDQTLTFVVWPTFHVSPSTNQIIINQPRDCLTNFAIRRLRRHRRQNNDRHRFS